jgi:surface antigen Omp85-like protein
MHRLIGVFLFIAFTWGLTSCNPVKKLGDNAYLLNKNVVKVDKGELKENLTPIIKQKPNRKLLGVVRFHLAVYTIFNRGKSNKVKEWFKRTIGEEPVLVDSILTERTTEQLNLYLNNKGFFNAVVYDTTIYKLKRKKARVIYTAVTGPQYMIRNIKYNITDPRIKSIVIQDTINSKIKENSSFEVVNFQKERDRLVFSLENRGYYNFNQQLISFNIDSTLGTHQVDVELIITGPDGPDSTKIHRIYKVDHIFIRTDYDPLSLDDVAPADTIDTGEYHFLFSEIKPRFKPAALEPRLYIEEKQTYAINKVNKTYRGLTNFGMFRLVNIVFEPTEKDSAGFKWLNSYVSLAPIPKQDYKLELEGTHNGGNFGIGTNFSYRNKNAFRGIELFEIKLKAVMETLPNFVDSLDSDVKPFDFNTFEIGPEFSLRVPRMLWPLNKNKSKLANPVSLFSALYNYQLRPEFKKNLAILSTGLEYSETKFKKHFIYPAEFNFAKVNLNPSFVDKLIETGDPLLLLYYRDYLITNGRYSFIYNNQNLKTRTDFFYLRANLEIAGNSLRLINLLTKSNYSKDSVYQVLNTDYSQYIRPDVEMRYYKYLNNNSQLVYRLAGGLGYAYLNSDFLPYEKVFYAGGANELRAFRPRKVGPGSYKDTLNFEQFGDIKISANIEYRFDIVKKFKGAFFLDAGNVWLRQDLATRPGGTFEIGNIANEMAIGTGIGFRFDFTFFIFRVDGGVPVRDPSLPKAERWVLDDTKFSSVIYNFGIGYPF